MNKLKIKIEHTEQYQYQLVLVNIGTDGDYPDYSQQIIGINHCWVRPIIISLAEKIEAGDWKYCPFDDVNKIQKQEGAYYDKDEFKILALPEHFSPKQLQAIASSEQSGYYKDGDKVLVECTWQCKSTDCDGDCDKKNISCGDRQHQIKLNSSNHITLYKVEEGKLTYQMAVKAREMGLNLNK